MHNDGIFVIVYSTAESEYFLRGNFAHRKLQFWPSRMIIIELMFGSESLSYYTFVCILVCIIKLQLINFVPWKCYLGVSDCSSHSVILWRFKRKYILVMGWEHTLDASSCLDWVFYNRNFASSNTAIRNPRWRYCNKIYNRI